MENIKPMILDFALKQVGNETRDYEYDFNKGLNVIKTKFGCIALVDSVCHGNIDIIELGTKTEAKKERDDHHHNLLELQTKTFTKPERDDENSSYYQ